MKKVIILALTAIYKKVVGRTLFNGNTYYWGRGGCCILALTALVMVGCEEKELKEITRHTTESFKNEPILRQGMIVDLDSCQYVVCDAYGGWAYVHHNNCRFCKERRQKELEELVTKLKEK